MALALGMTVGDMLRRMSSLELSEWMAFYQLEPWGTEMDDFRAGLVASTIANANRDPKKHRKPFSPSDFMPQYDKPAPEEQTPEDHAAIMGMWGRLWSEKFDTGDSQ